MGPLIITLSFLLFATKPLAQKLTLKAIEDDLHKTYLNLLNWSNYHDLGAYDSLAKENKNFRNKIKAYTSNYPFTLTYKFDSLQKDIFIVSSEDKLFRIYSWDTWLGGTMHKFENVFQYKSGNKVYSKLLYNSSGEVNYIPFYSGIYSLKANGKTYYLAINSGIYSTKDASQSIRIFAIENDFLNDKVKLIKTQSGLVNSIDIEYDFFSVVDRPERPPRLIKYDPKKKIIYIPIVLESGKVTDRFILYQFRGQFFKKILTQQGLQN